ncbi:competence protein ComEA [Clostridiales Family XIII bacterium PM5-7]
MKKLETKNVIKIAAVIVCIIVAFVFFGEKGEKQEIVIDEQQSSEVSEMEDEPELKLFVDISGQVKNPGVYQVEEGTRLFQLIELAGGLNATADINGLNQAEIITDGQKIIIPKEGEVATLPSITDTGAGQGLVNINQADSIALQEIPGVGPSTAEKIINYRNEHGRFKSIEEIKNVNGIGEKTYEKMKSKITV